MLDTRCGQASAHALLSISLQRKLLIQNNNSHQNGNIGLSFHTTNSSIWGSSISLLEQAVLHGRGIRLPAKHLFTVTDKPHPRPSTYTRFSDVLKSLLPFQTTPVFNYKGILLSIFALSSARFVLSFGQSASRRYKQYPFSSSALPPPLALASRNLCTTSFFAILSLVVILVQSLAFSRICVPQNLLTPLHLIFRPTVSVYIGTSGLNKVGRSTETITRSGSFLK